ncbi:MULTISPECIES: transposase [Flavobacterium]|uniref:Transposase IS200-like domain-containing protein n=1 Tax=Flavobacterium keumense TaxID=1306518 RepID=A0ABY8N861_9FLAO|nr:MULTISPECIES: transposase [Flavobacterium]WGK94766.1 hypothetical protein MG292_00635 [Flavobacterium keumense]
MINRKRNRMKGFDYSSNQLYFITNCVKNNVCCLGNVICVPNVGTGRDLSVHHPENNHPENNHPENIIMQNSALGDIVKKQIEWLMVQYSYACIHNYVIMPNHFHLILEINSFRIEKEMKIKSVSSLMVALKTTTSKQIHELGFSKFSWHRSFHDHVIKNEKEYQLISNYIDRNPQKWFEDRFYSKY